MICEKFGTKDAAVNNDVAWQENAATNELPKRTNRNGSLSSKVCSMVGAAALVLVASTTVSGCSGGKINLNDYMTVEFTGYDTVGKAAINFDSDQFLYDVAEKTSNKKIKKLMKSEDIEDLDDLGSAFELMMYLEDLDVDYSLDKTSGLSNGDEVTLTWDVDEEELKEDYGIKVKYTNETYTVSDLEAVETFDPFEYVDVVYTGIDPNGQASVNVTTNNELTNALNFSLDASSNLKNGDTITVTADSYYGNDTAAYFAENYGKIPSPTTKEYTVEGLGKYVTSVSEIPEDLMAQMQQQASDVFTADAATWESNVAIDNFQYIGYHFLTPKDSTSSTGNDIFLVYQVNANITDEDAGVVWIKYFWTILYRDIMLLPDGTGSVSLTDYTIPLETYQFKLGDSVWDPWYTFDGYEDLTSLQNECATQYLANWNVDSNVTEVN